MSYKSIVHYDQIKLTKKYIILDIWINKFIGMKILIDSSSFAFFCIYNNYKHYITNNF